MHGSRAAVDEFVAELQGHARPDAVEMLICVPFVYLERFAAALAGQPSIAVGAQDIAQEETDGAFTGEINGAMLADVGCSHVIVGHSERRTLYGESDVLVARKVSAAAAAGLQPMLCVGETLDERESGRAQQVLERQLQAVFAQCEAQALERLTIAYEPVWAIGTGRSASPEQAQQMHAFIRAQIAASNVTLSRSMRLLYGGSVKPDNAAALFAQHDVDGALVGGASLKAASFMNIARAIQ